MSEFLLYYKRPDPTTWVYLSSFLTIGLYFVFHRFWSIRNLDIVLLILLAPGLLMVHEGRRRHLREMESGEIALRLQSEQQFQRSYLKELIRGRAGQSSTFDGAPGDTAPGDTAPGDTSPGGTAPGDAAPGEAPPGVGQANLSNAATLRDTIPPSHLMLVAVNTNMFQSGEVATDDQTSRAAGPEQPLPEKRRPADKPRAPAVAPSIQEETKLPLVANPEALDERLEAMTLDPDQTESDAELSAKQLQRSGFIMLFGIEMLLLIRLLVDPMMSRRPLLDPNLTVGGLYFISISLFIFMMVNVATSTPRMQVWQGPELGPGYALMHRLPTISTRPISPALAAEDPATADELALGNRKWTILAKVLAIAAHLAIIVGVVLIGNRHFSNLRAGVGCALLYLMLPYTAQMTGRVDHALPAALLLWAVLCYRRPLIAGVFLGLAAGLVYYPLFLLPLWCSFYWQRGVRRFGIGVVVTLTILVVLLSIGGTDTLVDHLRRMFGLFAPTQEPRGIWGLGWDPRWRLPVIVAFGILCTLFAAWPSPKNLGTLIGCSAAVMVAVQFWHGYGGGLYIAWFLPLLLLTIFRPNLQDRVAVKVVHQRSADKTGRSGSSRGLSTAS